MSYIIRISQSHDNTTLNTHYLTFQINICNCIRTSKGISITCDFNSKINPKGNTAVYVKNGIR